MPRTLLVLEGWLEVLTDIKAIGIFRHPERVVKSLQNRDSSITDEAGLRLWLRYNERLLDYQREMGFPLVCFDDSDAELKDKFVTILSDLGIAKDRLAFFEPRLRSAPPGGHGDSRGRIESLSGAQAKSPLIPSATETGQPGPTPAPVLPARRPGPAGRPSRKPRPGAPGQEPPASRAPSSPTQEPAEYGQPDD